MESNDQSQSVLDEHLIVATNPKIYSRNAIRGFAFLCSTVFGGVLLYQNLKDIGKKNIANAVLIGSVLYILLETLILPNVHSLPRNASIIMNLIGAVTLSEFVFAKYFPNEKEYQKKKIWKSLIIAVILFGTIISVSLILLKYREVKIDSIFN